MKRSDTRNLVEDVGTECDALAALALYDHSIQCGHRKIALLRYMDARDLAAPLTERHHAYAWTVAKSLGMDAMKSIARQAVERSRQRRDAATKRMR
nr:hypothetical protein [Paraburkholderia diazotrophica]